MLVSTPQIYMVKRFLFLTNYIILQQTGELFLLIAELVPCGAIEPFILQYLSNEYKC